MTRFSLLVVGSLTTLPSTVAAQSTERLYQDACDGGDLIACTVFGLMYERGAGVEYDPARAVGLHERACEGGELVGCTNLGVLYERGSGVTEDAAHARGLYQVACEGGEPLGCERLSRSARRRLTPRHVKAGRVGDEETGEPLSGVLVDLVGLGMQVISDESGHFRLPGLRRGVYELRAERVGYNLLEGELPVPGDAEFLVLMTKTRSADPEAPGRIVGRVLEDGGRPLGDVEISVLGQDRTRTLSNSDGRFTLRDVEPGLIEVRMTHLGYAPRTATLVVQPDRTAEVATRMFIEPIALDPIQVTVRSSFLEDSGFYERSQRPWGTQFTPQQIELYATSSAADVIRGRTPGVRIQYGGYGNYGAEPPTDAPVNPILPSSGPGTTGGGGTVNDPPGIAPPSMGIARAVSRGGGSRAGSYCTLSVYLDGLQIPDLDLEQFPPDALAAIEVYTGLDTPAQYMGNPCGVVLLWTRRGA